MLHNISNIIKYSVTHNPTLSLLIIKIPTTTMKSTLKTMDVASKLCCLANVLLVHVEKTHIFDESTSNSKYSPKKGPQFYTLTCLSFKLEHSQETIIPSTCNETLVFVPGNAFQMDIVGNSNLLYHTKKIWVFCFYQQV